METVIRQDNLKVAWRLWFQLTTGEFAKLIEACRLEWGDGWLTEVLR